MNQFQSAQGPPAQTQVTNDDSNLFVLRNAAAIHLLLLTPKKHSLVCSHSFSVSRIGYIDIL